MKRVISFVTALVMLFAMNCVNVEAEVKTELVQGNILNLDTCTVGYMCGSTGMLYEDENYMITDYERVESGQTYSGWQYTNTLGSIGNTYCYDKNKNFIGAAIKGNPTNRITMLEGAYYARFSINVAYLDTTRRMRIVKGSEPVAYSAYYNEEVEVEIEYVTKNEYDKKIVEIESRRAKKLLNNKTIMCLGDSIMYGAGNEGTGLGELLTEGISANLYDYSMGGATIGYRTSDRSGLVDYTAGNKQNITYQAELAIKENAIPDFIFINGGTNDINYNTGVLLGEMTEGYAGEVDKTTFTGGLEYIFKSLKTAYPSAHIIYIRSHNMGSRGYKAQIENGNRAIEVCEKWSVPVVNVYRDSGLNTNLESMHCYTSPTETQPNGDRTHPNEEGYRRFYLPLIYDVIEKLM